MAEDRAGEGGQGGGGAKMRQPAPPPTFSRLGRSRPPRDAISYGKPVYVFYITHTPSNFTTPPRFDVRLRRWWSLGPAHGRCFPRAISPRAARLAGGDVGRRHHRAHRGVLRSPASDPPSVRRRRDVLRPARAIACARTSLRTCTARTPPRTFWRTPCATTWRIPTRPNPSSRPYTAPRASASLTSTSSSRRRCTTPSTTTTGRATRDSPLRLRATPTPTRVRPRPATRSADSARGATRRSTRRRPSRSTPPQRLARVDSVGAPARTAPRTRSSSARITSTSEREAQARRLRDALLDHLARFPESIVVVEEYDKMSCSRQRHAQTTPRQGFPRERHVSPRRLRLWRRTGFTQIKRKLDERERARKEEGDRDARTTSSSSSTSASLTAEETTATQRGAEI